MSIGTNRVLNQPMPYKHLDQMIGFQGQLLDNQPIITHSEIGTFSYLPIEPVQVVGETTPSASSKVPAEYMPINQDKTAGDEYSMEEQMLKCKWEQMQTQQKQMLQKKSKRLFKNTGTRNQPKMQFPTNKVLIKGDQQFEMIVGPHKQTVSTCNFNQAHQSSNNVDSDL